MRTFIKYLLITALTWGISLPLSAHINPNLEGKKVGNSNAATVRFDCSAGQALVQQSINNVRATLLTSGDVWWNGNDGRYIVPKVDPASGEPEVSSIFAGAVWLGGYEGTNLKVACQQYGSGSGNVDFWPGPLSDRGTTNADTCAQWDKHFRVTGAEIDLHRANLESGNDYDEADIPDGVKFYPGRGNEYFSEEYGFELPTAEQGLGAFFDINSNNLYEPLEGEYPIIDIRGCEELIPPVYPDELISWFYNDAGNTHDESGGNAIRMEVQVQSFGFVTNDELNNMTFQRYKLINRALTDIDSCYFAMWVDPDLGCYTDDYVGCDTSRSLMYIYNADELDGQTGCSCPGGVETYCDAIPMLGVDYFRGPNAPKIIGPNGELLNPGPNQEGDIIVELGMSSFTYYNNGGEMPQPPPGTDDPNTSNEYYNLLSGRWKDGTPFTVGGDGYNPGSTDVINYAFPDAPNMTGGFSMAQNSLAERDRRTVQASGPFRLESGSVNELIIGVPWVPNVAHPAPSIDKLTIADDLAQALFDNCFLKNNGPDAPNVDWIELDQKLVALLSNDTLIALTNNICETYEEKDLRLPGGELIADTTYKFEGYQVYQIASPSSAGEADLNDPDHYRLVAQVDLKNGIRDLYQWETISNPTTDPTLEEKVYIPNVRVSEAMDDGIKHAFEITTDLFTGNSLINHKKYYYRVIAYGYNGFALFDPSTGTGQARPYINSQRNIGDGENSYYTVIPRQITDRVLNAEVGDQPQITRLDGIGAGETSLRITEDTRTAIMDGSFDGTIVYQTEAGPIKVAVYNPLEVVDADFELKITDDEPEDDVLEGNITWTLNELDADGKVVNTIKSKFSIEQLNEQLIEEYGIAISIAQSDEPGEMADEENGAIEAAKTYLDPNGPIWLGGIPDGGLEDDFPELYNYVKTEPNGSSFALDINSNFANLGDGTWVPYTLCDWSANANGQVYLTPAWFNSSSSSVRFGNKLESLPNVDIVFTSNKELWSKCIVVETASSLYDNFTDYTTEGDANQFDLRAGRSVDKSGAQVSGDETGMGYFPGYAINVETGERLNIFFGENSIYDCSTQEFCSLNNFQDDKMRGRDMLWNPTDERYIISGFNNNSLLSVYDGGQHMIYVAETAYDECEELETLFRSDDQLNKIRALRRVKWASYSLLQQGQRLLSNGEGVIPNDVTVHLRVDNPYNHYEGVGTNNGNPCYQFNTRGFAPTEVASDEEIASVLDAINVVPNPYYGFSDYETDQFSNIIKITNLPAKSVITIYSLEGKFIRQYKRDEQEMSTSGETNPSVRNRQYLPDLEWDLKNNAGIPVASGVYLIHVSAEGLGERTLKWFGVARQFDPSGL